MEGAILRKSTAATSARHHFPPIVQHRINRGDIMDHQDPLLKNRRQQSDNPARNSVTEPGPADPFQNYSFLPMGATNRVGAAR